MKNKTQRLHMGKGSTSHSYHNGHLQEETPSILLETFPHPITPLIERFNQWEQLLTSLCNYFESQKETANSLCNIYLDAVKGLEQTLVQPSVFHSLNVSPPYTQDSPFDRAMAKLESFTEKFNTMGQKFDFQYVLEGGVNQNIACLRGHAEQLALLQDKHREHLLDSSISKIKDTRDSTLKQRQTALKAWMQGLDEMESLRNRAIVEYNSLVHAIQLSKLVKGKILLRDDPHRLWLRYQSLRDEFLNKFNSLRVAAVIHQEECKTCEAAVVSTIRNVVNDYLDTVKHLNLKIKALSRKDAIVIDNDEESKNFLSNHPCLPLQKSEPRKLRFFNDIHPRVLPLVRASLYLNRFLPWYMYAARPMKPYIVTSGGYLIKENRTARDTTPKRAFRLSDCIIAACTPRGGEMSFIVYGVNCCWRDYSLGTDHKKTWKFTGMKNEVRILLDAINLWVPVIRYEIAAVGL